MTELRDITLDYLAAYVSDSHEDIPTSKLLRALVEFAPTERGRTNICDEILSSRSATGGVDSTMLKRMAERYFTGLLFPMATTGPMEPDMVEVTSPPIDLRAGINQTIIEQAKHDPHNMAYLALRRDGFRSLMTEKPDVEAVKRSLVEGDPSVDLTITQATHVLPLVPRRGNSQTAESRNKSDIWELIRRFSGEDLHDELAGPNINRLENVLTLGLIERIFFRKLEIWFQATAEPHVYVVRGRGPMNGIYMEDKVVRFGTTNDLIPLPSPRYLALHAACAQVVHACGVGAFIDRMITDVKELDVLPEDGCSDALLFALHRVSTAT